MAPPASPAPPFNPKEPLAALEAAAPALARLAARGVPRCYTKGSLLIREGDHGDTLYVILDGRLRAFSENDKGRRITYGEYGLSEFVGEMSLDGGPRAASVEAAADTWCAVVTRTTLERHIVEEPAFAFELLAKVIRLAREATLSTKQLALNDAYGRVKRFIEREASPQPDGGLSMAVRPTHQEIADRAGCARAMVSKVMKDLYRGGYLLDEQGGGLRLTKRLPPRW